MGTGGGNWSKSLRHLATGESELARICSREDHSAAMSVQVYRCLQNSKEASDAWQRFKTELAGGPPMDLGAWARTLLAAKKVPTRYRNWRRVQENLRLSLEDLYQWERAKQIVHERVNTSFQSADKSHQELLQKLRQLVEPMLPAGARAPNRDWRYVGFQGDDPGTDFRGMGIFALHQLIYFAETRPRTVQRILSEANEERWSDVSEHTTSTGSSMPQLKRYYPFAVTGIHVSAFVARLVQQGALMTAWIGESSDTILRKINDLYCDTFILFHELWRKGPERSIMEFQQVFRECCAQVERQIQLGVFLPHAP